MVLVLVIGCLVFTMLIFKSMVTRLRHENSLTNRTSVNERLYQIAASIGRLTIRKLQRDIETRDPAVAKKILDAVFVKPQATIDGLYKASDIVDMDVIKEIITQFKSKWGPLDIEVETAATIGNDSPFSPEIRGLEKSPFERRGSIDIRVSVEHRGVRKTCRIRKEFLLTRLFAPPFHKFTLFARRGAEVDEAKVNRIEKLEEDGKVTGPPPLVLFNRLLRAKGPGKDGLDFTLNRPDHIIKDASSLTQNGWVYLGGNGKSTDATNKSGNLMLNVCAGAEKDFTRGYFGEFFHFHFDTGSKGWLGSREWNTWLDSKIPGNDLGGGNHRVMVTFVDYGIYAGLAGLAFGPSQISIFGQAIASYRGANTLLTKGSALHLFGTPSLCTPTLVFGQVKRRYVRTFAFYFTKAQRVYPIRAMTSGEWDFYFNNEIGPWAANRGIEQDLQDGLRDSIAKTILPYDTYWYGKRTNSPPLCRLPPEFRDWEPYMAGLKNISKPTDPGAAWTTAIPRNLYCPDKPDQVCTQDFTFASDPEIHFTGKLQDLRVTPGYLKDKMSYYITECQPGKFLKLSSCKFFMDRFVDKSNNKNQVFLNQIVGFNGDLEIDIPLEVLKGGVIYAKGTIRINNSVINPFIANPPTTPDAFGYLTFVSDTRIELNPPGGSSSSSGGLPQFHGFLVCMRQDEKGEVEVQNPVHIIGGVAVDVIDK
ncbi:MAG: hypothetical protein GX442_04205, partial [Candidatus Riflebacteria bacterium]|nr:hypothetical protein [Candidatus Riflebacteria bacterium]